MVVKENQPYNLWDTNGRRNDILNAINIYLHILCDIKENYPTEEWKPYPKSLAQYLFYQKAIEASPEVFSIHKNYDEFMENLGSAEEDLLSKDKDWLESAQYLEDLKDSLDKNIEQRARHYTSNLVKIGFTDEDRNITNAGWSFLKGNIKRDPLEELLPIDDTNLVLFRQLLKMRVFSKPKEKDNDNEVLTFCSPTLMGIFALLNSECIDKDDFIALVQGLNPYFDKTVFSTIQSDDWVPDETIRSMTNGQIIIPEPFVSDELIDFETFSKFIKNRKSSANSVSVYYGFYTALYRYRENPSEENYTALLSCLLENKEMLKKAFGYGKNIFDTGRGKQYSIDVFATKNEKHVLLTTEHLNSEIYTAYFCSKYVDSSREYSDTTIRLLGATGLFKFKPLPELAYKEALKEIFTKENIKNDIFGEMTKADYYNYEVERNGFFRNSTSLVEILRLSKVQVDSIIGILCSDYGVDNQTYLKSKLNSKLYDDFESYIVEVYPKERVIFLLSMFSDRSNDKRIQKEVNEAATVPTIYEYLIAIAWYYISNRDFNLYDSLNLTLNADFEPVVHAGGGAGDIVISYSESVIMLEVTLMNKQAQKRGEWEPVLRHSLNLKADNKDKDTITFFIADELDYNTINIWRAVAAVPLESTTSHDEVDGVVIMPFTNSEVIRFLEENTESAAIIQEVSQSFEEVPKITDSQWRDRILERI